MSRRGALCPVQPLHGDASPHFAATVPAEDDQERRRKSLRLRVPIAAAATIDSSPDFLSPVSNLTRRLKDMNAEK